MKEKYTPVSANLWKRKAKTSKRPLKRDWWRTTLRNGSFKMSDNRDFLLVRHSADFGGSYGSIIIRTIDGSQQKEETLQVYAVGKKILRWHRCPWGRLFRGPRIWTATATDRIAASIVWRQRNYMHESQWRGTLSMFTVHSKIRYLEA